MRKLLAAFALAILLCTATAFAEGLVVDSNGTAEVTVEAPADGEYNLAITYQPLEDILLNSPITVVCNGSETVVELNSLWKDEEETYSKDRYGNDALPDQQTIKELQTTLMRNSVSTNKSPATFYLKNGSNTITIHNSKIAIEVQDIYAVAPKTLPNYQQYLSSHSGSAGDSYVIIEAEKYSSKSDSFIRPKSVQNKALYPYQLDAKLLNVIDPKSFKDSGQWVEWQFDVDSSGFYNVTLRYSQTEKQNMPVFGSVFIDGEIPFEELYSYAFPYTGVEYENMTLGGDSPYEIYLEKGSHTIRIMLDGAPISSYIDRAYEILEDISDIGLEIGKIAGTSVVANRSWDIETYIPGLISTLEGYKNELADMYKNFTATYKGNPKASTTLNLASKALNTILEKPKKIPAKLNLLSQGSGSVTQMIADFITDAELQNLSVDRLYISNGQKLPPAKEGFFSSLAEGVKRFFMSIFSPRNQYTADVKSEGEINVWVNRTIQYVEQMQVLADSKFTPNTGINVKFSIMPNEQKLILSNASATSPDVAMGLWAATPYDLALRGAITDFTQFPDFKDFMEGQFNINAFQTFVFDGKIYGTIDTMDYFVLIYRTDILEDLGIEIPETWDDVADLMPVLRRNGMNMFIPLSQWTGNKPLYSTTPFIFQNGGEIYSEDGFKTLINSEASIKGFETLTNLYSNYALQKNIPNFYNSFRYGTVPIGVCAFAEYVKLVNAAPEIAGRWDIAIAPGTRRPDGSINRSYTAAERANVIFESSEMKQESWEFLKWWLSEDTQTEYSYSMQTKFGPEYMYNPGNLKAFDKLQMPQKHKDVILQQWSELIEVPRHPAGYLLERELTSAWINVVDQGWSARVAMDSAAININREIERKLDEFGYIKDGVKVRDYKILTPAEILGVSQ